jgi:hypothetical protein
MSTNRQIYDLAAKAGSLEGWVYKRDVDAALLPRWIQNIVDLYNGLPREVREELQDLCDETIGRTIHSLRPLLGADHELIGKLKGMVVGTIPSSPYDFPRKKLEEQKGT